MSAICKDIFHWCFNNQPCFHVFGTFSFPRLFLISFQLPVFMCVYVHQMALVSFGSYVLSSPDNVLDANRAFVSLALFNVMSVPISMLPNAVSDAVQV